MKEIIDQVWNASASAIITPLSGVLTGAAVVIGLFFLVVFGFIVYVFISIIRN